MAEMQPNNAPMEQPVNNVDEPTPFRFDIAIKFHFSYKGQVLGIKVFTMCIWINKFESFVSLG